MQNAAAAVNGSPQSVVRAHRVAISPFNKMWILFLSLVICQLVLVAPLDLGKGGVYDSPLATDILVREFGFLFGGGRSGVKGIEAFQVSIDS